MKRYKVDFSKVESSYWLAKKLNANTGYIHDLKTEKVSITAKSELYIPLKNMGLLIDVTDELRFEKLKRNQLDIYRKLNDGELTEKQVKYYNDRLTIIETEMMKLIVKKKESYEKN